eukprot:748102-Pyramimonas_sp.AAC.1
MSASATHALSTRSCTAKRRAHAAPRSAWTTWDGRQQPSLDTPARFTPRRPGQRPLNQTKGI